MPVAFSRGMLRGDSSLFTMFFAHITYVVDTKYFDAGVSGRDTWLRICLKIRQSRVHRSCNENIIIHSHHSCALVV